MGEDIFIEGMKRIQERNRQPKDVGMSILGASAQSNQLKAPV